MSFRRTLWLSCTIILMALLVACGGAPASQEPASSEATAQPAAATNPTSAPSGQAKEATAAPTPAPVEGPAGDATEAPAGDATESPAADATKAPSLGGGDAAGSPSGDPEPNSQEEAAEIEAGKTSGSLIEDDEDWFIVEVPASGIVTITFTPAAGAEPMGFVVRDEDDHELYAEYNIGPSGAEPFNQIVSGATAVRYAVMVSGGPGKYTLDVTIESQDDAGSGGDAGDNPVKALDITAGQVIAGMVGDLDEEDYYAIDIDAGTVLTITFVATDDAGGKGVAFFDPDEHEIWAQYSIGSKAASFNLILGEAGAGTYYVRATGSKGTYEFQVDTASQNDAESGMDAGDDLASAIETALGGQYAGLVGDEDRYDYYTFEAEGGDILDITLTAGDDAESLGVQVLDPDEHEMWAQYSIGHGSSKSFSHVLGADLGGTYYIRVSGGHGEYTLDLSAAAQNDAESGGDAGDEPNTAVLVEPDTTYTGQVGGSDETDLYAIEVEGGTILSLSFTADKNAAALYVQLTDADDHELWQESRVRSGKTVTYTYVVGSEVGGTYHLRVRSSEEQDGYSFTFEMTNQDDGGSGGDAGDTVGGAVFIEPDQEYTGILGGEDTDDYYEFEPEVGQVLVITGGEGTDAIYATVLDGEEYELWEVRNISSGDTAEFEITEIEGETPYLLRVYSSYGGTYTIEILPAD